MRAKATNQTMTLFKKQISFIQSIENDLYSSIRRAVENYDFIIKDYVVNKQLFQKGVDGKGKRLKGYKRTTIRVKLSKGQPVDRTTLLDKGKFHASITVDAYSDRFEISSDVSYDKYIVRKYGKDVLLPSNENMSEFFRVYLLPTIKKKINDKLTR